jgi:SPASM domain peptide maturase of grasp-with-spasm system
MYFLLYPHNQIVQGVEGSVIYNLDDSNIINIPNELVVILNELPNKTIDEIKREYTPNHPEIIDQYINLFKQKNLGFFVSNPDNFTPLDLEFHYPGLLQNAIIETNLESYDLQSILKQIDSLGCKNLELRVDINHSDTLNKFFDIFDFIDESILNYVRIIINYNDFLKEDFLKEKIKFHPKIVKILVHSAKTNVTNSPKLSYTVKTLYDLDKEGFSKKRYIVNRSFFSESKKFNPFYNKSVSITILGDVKNSLFDSNVFGNVNQTKLLDIVSNPDFQKLWGINADKIYKIKDSSLRYAMFDLAPLEEMDNGEYAIKKNYEQ